MSVQIDALHSREICAEIGDRLREVFQREATSELPPRLRYLMEQLTEADCEVAPSLVPSLEDMVRQEPIDFRHGSTACESIDEQSA